jgi:hypothetical protein
VIAGATTTTITYLTLAQQHAIQSINHHEDTIIAFLIVLIILMCVCIASMMKR